MLQRDVYTTLVIFRRNLSVKATLRKAMSHFFSNIYLFLRQSISVLLIKKLCRSR